MQISIIIPVYHEEKNIEKVLKQIKSEVKTPHETLIVYDTKRDPTFHTVTQLSNKYKNTKLVRNNIGSKKGVVNAIKTGISQSKGEVVVIVMADLSDEISAIDKMFGLIQQGYDIIAASRYIQGGKKVGGPILKTYLSKVAGLSLHYIFKIPTRDATNAYKMYRKSIFRDIRIESTGGFEYSLEIVLKAYNKGYKITEIPTIWYDRMEGKSNFKLIKWLPKYIKTYLLVFKKNE